MHEYQPKHVPEGRNLTYREIMDNAAHRVDYLLDYALSKGLTLEQAGEVCRKVIDEENRLQHEKMMEILLGSTPLFRRMIRWVKTIPVISETAVRKNTT